MTALKVVITMPTLAYLSMTGIPILTSEWQAIVLIGVVVVCIIILSLIAWKTMKL